MPDLTLPGQPPPPLFFPPFPNEEKMRRGRLNAEAPLGLLGETHSVGRRESANIFMFSFANKTIFCITALSATPKIDNTQNVPGAHPYRHDLRGPQPQIFDLDLDLNPDL